LTTWKTKYTLPYSFLSDPSRKALQKLGVAKNPSGVIRSHIVISKGGKLAYGKFPTPAKESAADALEFIKNGIE
jgi:peroxiredoxin Q/BCP